ncbi:hypothetical protein SUGI_1172980 [Cryptomeria japonica]|uniref:uncharacterized protein LOC131068354 n=1 Tax=Cryptomeria japonica TaxID=3369 RepID=UPI00241475F6|nr:uncharacterized protein LOC131068354 [Cryptomeria japonica]GLJ54601.1 hypothetical protein SUGI_1172980 [Cryptomeria japonica]
MEEESFRLGPGLLLDDPDHDRHQMVVFRDDEDEEEKLVECPSASSNEHDMDSDADGEVAGGGGGHMAAGNSSSSLQPTIVNPEPHISAQFYTFNRESHHLMVHCILEGRFASPEEIRSATPPSVLLSWRSVWKDRNEDTAYLTGWKRIQDKLHAHIDEHGNEVLYFKNNSQQYVSHINQWQEIVMSFHGDADLKHLGLKETIERIKQVWTVGAKFYGIPESFIRVCIASCVVCCSDVAASAPRNKRRRFEYTESFEVPAKEVPQNLQQLAAKHKVVLCIRQKYIRYKPFMAEVKDYACHRAGEPNTKRSGVLKRERYTSKRCGCGFRIRAIVPITNYNEKDKTFSYQEEGKAIFKLYAVHSGHEPGPHEGSARIIHRFVGQGSLVEQDQVYANDDSADAFALIRKEDTDSRMSVLQQVHELRMEIGFLESKIANMSHESLVSLSQDLCAITRRLRSVEELPRSTDMLMGKAHSDEVLVTNPGLEEWGEHHHHHDHHHRRQHCGDVKPGEDEDDDIIGGDNGAFGIAEWQRQRLGCSSKTDVVLRDDGHTEKWIDSVKEACPEFDEKSILVCEDSKLCKPIRQDSTIVADGSLVAMHVEGFYQENAKWYEGMPCGLDPNAVCGDDLTHTVQDGFRHGGIA